VYRENRSRPGCIFLLTRYINIARSCSSCCLQQSRLLIAALILGTINIQSAYAINTYRPPTVNNKSDPSLCPITKDTGIQFFKPRAFPEKTINNTEISADYTQSSSDGKTSLDGNVIIEKHRLRISTDHADYDRQSDQLNVSGNVLINTETMSLKADGGTISMDSNNDSGGKSGSFNNIQFTLPKNNMKGRAEKIKYGNSEDEDNKGNAQSILDNASITSCDLFDPDWLISADEIDLDHDDEYGTAEDVTIRFKGVPFMYTPYIEFPTSDRRRSGLLFPEFGTSSSRGAELSAPVYWNIAPNKDALVEPRYMERRGFELGGNYRFLTKATTGKLYGAYLPEDDVTKTERYQVRYQQHTLLTSDLLFDIDLQDISDADYFNDFANNIESTSQTHLNRKADMGYNLDNWQFKAMVQDIKTIDDSTPTIDRPYERRPQLTFNGDTEIANSSIYFTLDSEYVDFTHENRTKLTGSRTTLKPGLRLPISGTYWFINPAVKLSFTKYNVGTVGDINNPGTKKEVDDRSLPIASIDAGLLFDRDLSDGYQQTLEPRLYYLNVPFEDQSNTPLFDTSTPNFSIAQLFRDNRFVGGDRLGDTNQLTVAMTSRILNTHTGNEFLRASIGQIFYFEDRKVSLDGSVDRSSQSDIIAELATNWGNWLSSIDLQWDTSRDEFSQENYFLHYKSDSKHLFNIGFRKRLADGQVDIKQTDTSFLYAITNEYNVFARWNYSLEANKDIDIIGGIAYDSCCWSIQLMTQRRLKNTTELTSLNDEIYDNSILVQFVFKGIGSLSGSRARKSLERSIYGYEDPYQ
jgi:LPS-assembly protein